MAFFKLGRFAPVVFIIILVAALYANSLFSPLFLDDELLVKKNYLIRSFRFLPQVFLSDLTIGVKSEANFYRPLQTISYMTDYHFWKLNPFGFHLTSVILFMLNAVLVYFLVGAISGSRRLAAFTAVFFAAHPIYCEAVAYTSGRAEVLLGIFLFLSLLLFINYPHFAKEKSRVLFIAALLSFALGLLSKELAVIFPLVLWLYDFSFEPDKLKNGSSFLRRHGPFIILGLIYILLRNTILKFSDTLPATANVPVLKRLMIFAANFNFYFGMLFFPFGLHMSRTFLVPTYLDVYVICGVVSLAFIIGGLFFWYRRDRQIFFWSAWFLLWLLPQSGIFPINSFLAEHFIYFSAIGFFAILAFLIFRLLTKRAAAVFVLCFAAMSGFGTVWHNRDWHNEQVFYENILKFSPQSWLAHVNLGNVYLNQRRYAAAEQEYLKALALHPKLLVVHSDLALIYIAKGNGERAIKEIGLSLGLDDILTSRGNIRFPPKHEYLKIIRKGVDIVNMYNGLGILFSQYRLYDYAHLAFAESLKLAPDYADAHWNLGFLFREEGKYDAACKEWKLAKQIDPHNLQFSQWLEKAGCK